MLIKKSSLEVLFLASKEIEKITLSEARIRDSFIKPLSVTLQSFYDDRKKIYDTFCLKKEDGTPDLKDGDKYQFPKDTTEADNELKTLLSEEVEVNFPAGIKEILEKTSYSPKVGEVEVLDEILTKL